MYKNKLLRFSLYRLDLYLPIAFGYLLLFYILQEVFSRFLLTGFKISAGRSEEHNNRITGKEKASVLFS